MKVFCAALLICLLSPALRNSVPRFTANHAVIIAADANGHLFVSDDKMVIPVGGVIEWYAVNVTGCAIAFASPGPDVSPGAPLNDGDTTLQFNGRVNHDYKYSVTCDGYPTLDPHVIIIP